MTTIPRDNLPESSLALLRDGYEFISKRCERLNSDVFQARLLLRKTICMRGEEAARLFYDERKVRRRGGAPWPLLKVLFGEGGVQGLDDEAHRHRKAMFMSLMSPESIERLARISEENWRVALARWQGMEQVVLFDEVRGILCRSVCAWAGVPLKESEADERTNELGSLIDDSGAFGPAHFRGRLARKRVEQWIGGLVEDVRAGRLLPAEESALRTIALHRGLQGDLLDTRVAAVEVINVLRPTVAVARFVTFAALALHEHPRWRQRISREDGQDLEPFVQEVRRFYPFFPFVAGRVRKPFEWRGCHFPQGVRIILDLYGTNHDSRIWEQPDAFRPERFRGWGGNAFSFIPQGGGNHHAGHRCPGEWITIELMKAAVRFLTTAMDYDVPDQDLTVSLSRMPAIPESRFVITRVRPLRLVSDVAA